MSGGYSRHFFVARTRALTLYMNHLENKPDSCTVGEIISEIKPLLEFEGFFNSNCSLYFVDAESGEVLPDTFTVKELRAWPVHRYRLRLFFESFMDITTVRV